MRDIIFESHQGYPNPVMLLLEKHGYTLFQLKKRFNGPFLEPIQSAEKHSAENQWEANSYLATLDPNRAKHRLQARGWKVLKS